MQTLEWELARVETTMSPKAAYNAHLRACPQCFRATARGELCHGGVPLFDALPPFPAAKPAPGGVGSYALDGLDDAMTFSSRRATRPRHR
jgi:hypothetical protein